MPPARKNYHDRVFELARMIPAGEVASYGLIASLLPGVTARMVGYAMSATPDDSDIPWWRVINSAGRISPRPGSERQREMLAMDDIALDATGRIDWREHQWQGPDPQWFAENTADTENFLEARQRLCRQP